MVDKVALVDIDGCLVQDGKLNMALVERLKSGGYDNIALFTQRSKYMMYYRWMRGESPSESPLFLTPDIVEALAKEGLNVTVSTSVDHCFGAPLAYYDGQLAPFERLYEPLLSAYKPIEGEPPTKQQQVQLIALRKEILAELKAIAATITEDMAKAMAEALIKKIDEKTLKNILTEEKTKRPDLTSEQLANELIDAEKNRLIELLASIKTTNIVSLPEDFDTLINLIAQWSTFHPESKIVQKQELDKRFPTAQIDYFDDAPANIVEIHEADSKNTPTSFVVQGAFIIPLEIYQSKGFTNNSAGRDALKEALAFKNNTFTVQDITGYLSNKNPDVQAFGRQLMAAAEVKAIDVFSEVKKIIVANPEFQQKFKGDDRFTRGLTQDFKSYCMTQKLEVLQAIANGGDTTKLLSRYDASRPEYFYQDYLLQKAKEVIANTPDAHLRFDTQARVLTEVTLTEKDYQAIYENILRARGPGESRAEPTYQQTVERLLCLVKPLSKTTLCNIDIRKDEDLREKFQNWLCTVETPCAAPSTFRTSSVGGFERVNSVDSADHEHERPSTRQSELKTYSDLLLQGDNVAQMGSINALQEEMEMHISLALQVHRKAFEATYKPDSADAVPGMLWDRAREKAITDMTKTVRTTFQDALIASHKNGAIDFVSLNNHLDKARQHLKGNCQDALVKACLFTIPDFQERCREPAIANKISRKAYAATTATPNDYFTSSSTGLSTRIAGSINTAHHKAAGDGHQAMRIIAHSDGSVMMRLPSIPEVDIKYASRLFAWAKAVSVSFQNVALSAANGFLSVANAFLDESKQINPYDQIIGPWQAKLNDTALKIIEAEGELRTKLGGYAGPIILNRETSIPNAFLDNNAPGANRQGLRIEIEIKAIHQVNANRTDGLLVLIQGIPVNQHTQNLGYNTSGVLKEATLMAEMAMLANLREQLPDKVNSQAYEKVIKHYQEFLKKDSFSTNTFFCDSKHGQDAIKELTSLKQQLAASETPPAPSQDLKVMANQALLQVFSHDLHMDKRYGMLIQALSTYGQTTAIAGCKSANERFAEVEGRADLLRQLNLEPCQLPKIKQDMLAALQNFGKDPGKIDALVACMDKCFNEYTLQERSSAAVSLLDQGAASKVGAFKEGSKTFQFFDTNRVENAAVDRLKTKNASAMQAHKSDHAAEIKEKTQAFGRGDDLEAAYTSKIPLGSGVAQLRLDGCNKQIQVLHDLLRYPSRLRGLSEDQLDTVEEIRALIEDPFSAISSEKLLAKVVASGVLDNRSEDTLSKMGIERLDKNDVITSGGQAAADVYELTNPGTFELRVDLEVSRANPALLQGEAEGKFKAFTAADHSSSDVYGGTQFAAGRFENELRSHFDQKALHDPAYVAHRSEALEMVLDQDQKQKLYAKLLPPSGGVSQSLSSVSNENVAKQTMGEKVAMATLKYGTLAAAIATFVLSKAAM